MREGFKVAGAVAVEGYGREERAEMTASAAERLGRVKMARRRGSSLFSAAPAPPVPAAEKEDVGGRGVKRMSLGVVVERGREGQEEVMRLVRVSIVSVEGRGEIWRVMGCSRGKRIFSWRMREDEGYERGGGGGKTGGRGVENVGLAGRDA